MTDQIAPLQKYLAAKLEMAIARAAEEPTLAPSITISRQAGARAVSIGEKLTAHLQHGTRFKNSDWTLFDQNLVKTIIEDNHLPHELEQQMPEDRVHLMPTDRTLFQRSAYTIRKLCRLGHAVVVGRAGNFITEDLTNTFRIRLVGSFECRRDHLQQKFSMTAKAAQEYIHEKDTARMRYVKSHVHEDIEDSTAYHLTINTDELSDDSVVAIITYSLEEWAAGPAKVAKALRATA